MPLRSAVYCRAYASRTHPSFPLEDWHMHRRISVIPLFAAVTLAACSPDVAVAPAKAPKSPALALGVSPKSGSYVVQLNGNGRAKDFTLRVSALGGSVTSYHEGAGIAVVSGLNETGAAALAASGVGELQPDFVFTPFDQSTAAQPDAAVVTDISIQSQDKPATASRFPWQWNMRLIGADTAWAHGKLGSSSVTVAIIDTGLDYNVADLNGLVDLGRSKSFMDTFVGRLDDTTTVADEYTPIVPPDDTIAKYAFPARNRITDFNGHGTNVANQVSSNAAALAGVTSKTTLIGVKVLGANGFGTFSDILNGVLWAADKGADVANMSLGGGFSKSGNGQAVALINRVFNYARQKGMVIVVAAGNSGTDLQHNGNAYATYCDAPHVICVSSVGPMFGMFTPTTPFATSDPDVPAYYTSFGKNSVDIAAPGGNGDAAHGFTQTRWPWSALPPGAFTNNDKISWVWGFCAKDKLVIVKNADGINGDLGFAGCSAGNRIFPYHGTSQAAPHVAGLAALLIAENGKGNPEQIKHLIQKSSDPINGALGRGRISVRNAFGL
jgi:lantibiotic leader peptide-processing serine protease